MSGERNDAMTAPVRVRVHNETLSLVAMRVHNPDRSPAGIHG
jgi:hypothetical protein